MLHSNIVNNDYQRYSIIFYRSISNKSFDELLHVRLKNFTFFKTVNSGFSYIEVWFTDQNSEVLNVEDKINITLVIN